MKIIAAFKTGKIIEYPKGQIILFQGEKSYYVYRIVSGFIKVYDIDANGNNKIILILGKGNIFPLLSVLIKTKNGSYFYETMDNTKLELISQSAFRQKLKKDHEFALSMLNYSASLTHDLFARIECIEATDSLHKISHVLKYLILHHGDEKSGSFIKINVPLTHQIIADMAGVVRETSSLKIKELEVSKALKIKNSKIFYVNEVKLDNIISST